MRGYADALPRIFIFKAIITRLVMGKKNKFGEIQIKNKIINTSNFDPKIKELAEEYSRQSGLYENALKNLKKEYDELQNDIHNKHDELKNLKKEYNEIDDKLFIISNQTIEKNTSLNNINIEIKKYSEKLELLKKEGKEIENNIIQAKILQKNLNKNIENKKLEFEKISDDLAKEMNINITLAEENNNLQSQISLLQNQLGNLKKIKEENEKLKKENNFLLKESEKDQEYMEKQVGISRIDVEKLKENISKYSKNEIESDELEENTGSFVEKELNRRNSQDFTQQNNVN
jgi:chromosome segregation ATPase